MQEAQLWHSRYRGELPDLQRAYLSAVFALSARATRRKQIAVVAAIGLLSILVIAAGVGLVMIRSAQQEATAQAHRAENQLVLTQSAERAAKASATAAKDAEKVANDERAKTDAANHELQTTNANLTRAIQAAEQARREAETARVDAERAQAQAEAARRRAESAKRKEQRSNRAATLAAQEARKAEAEAKLASERLQTNLATERQRVQALEALTRGAKIITEVPVN